MPTPAEFAVSQGLTLGAAPLDFGIQAADDPAYEGVVATPAENGVDDPERVVLILFSDDTAAPADSSPYDPTNAGDPVSPQQIAQSAGARPYPDGILHAFPNDPSMGGVTPPPPMTEWTASAMTAANPSVATVADTTDLVVGTLVTLSGDPLVNGQTVNVSAIAGDQVTLDIDLSGGAPAGPVTLTKSV